MNEMGQKSFLTFGWKLELFSFNKENERNYLFRQIEMDSAKIADVCRFLLKTIDISKINIFLLNPFMVTKDSSHC